MVHRQLEKKSKGKTRLCMLDVGGIYFSYTNAYDILNIFVNFHISIIYHHRYFAGYTYKWLRKRRKLQKKDFIRIQNNIIKAFYDDRKIHKNLIKFLKEARL